MNIIDKVKLFLEDEGVLPVSDKTWNVFEIIHAMPSDDDRRKEQYGYIKSKVDKRGGIYVYMKDAKCIYVGKAKLLFDRLKSHYIESSSPVPGDTKDMRWHRFFSSYQGNLTVYWMEFKEEEERQIVELLLTKFLKPEFLSFK